MLWTDEVFLKMLGWIVLAALGGWAGDRWWARKEQKRALREGRVPTTTYDVRRDW